MISGSDDLTARQWDMQVGRLSTVYLIDGLVTSLCDGSDVCFTMDRDYHHAILRCLGVTSPRCLQVILHHLAQSQPCPFRSGSQVNCELIESHY
jgi:hypothetical protein